MRFAELAILLPCHSLEDFPQYHTGTQADGLLACFTALWHPALIASAKKLPTWHRADDPPVELDGVLLTVPEVSETIMLAGWATRAVSEGACVVRGEHDRDEILRQAIAGLGEDAPTVDAELAADFLALGFGYLQIELLSRRMRYMSSLDEVQIEKQTLAAAEAAVDGDGDTARKLLAECFEVLTEARERFYPVELYLIDLTLTAETTLGPALRSEIASQTATNLLLSGKLLDQLAKEEPDTLVAIRTALESETLSIAGGEYEEDDAAMLPIEDTLDQLKKGRETYLRHLDQSPKIFGRRHYGLAAWMPQLLSRSGFDGALHFTLDGGTFAKTERGKAQWEGTDGSTIECIARVPLDANAGGTFLNLTEKVGDAMDVDQVATVSFAHWPGLISPWYEDLRRIARYGTAMGRFVTLDDYFHSTNSPGFLSQFDPDGYQAPYLRSDVDANVANPISRFVDRHRQRAFNDAIAAVDMMSQAMVTGSDSATPPKADDKHPKTSSDLPSELASATMIFATGLPTEEGSSTSGSLVINPLSFTQRRAVEIGGDAKPGQQRVVKVPGQGFTWVAPRAATPTSTRKKPTVIAEETTLQNEHLMVRVDPHTGAVRSLYENRKRGNRLSQQVSLRRTPETHAPFRAGGEDPSEYSVMAADSVEVSHSDTEWGEIVSSGRLITPEGKTLATFRQATSLARASRVLNLEFEIHPTVMPEGNPWMNYYAARFAWGDAGADLYRSLGMTPHHTSANRIEAPHFVEIRGEEERTAILCGGLPYHRRVDMRMLDTLLITAGETQTHFKLAIGVGLPHPLHGALGMMSPMPVVESAEPALASSWLFHIDAKNIVATAWSEIVEDGQLMGFRVRLLETAGRHTQATLQSFRPIDSARHVTFTGSVLSDLRVEYDVLHLDLTRYEWAEIEARFSDEMA